ncbi:MAG: hypothetical protein AB1458_09380 [Bacteroidota bacterium]
MKLKLLTFLLMAVLFASCGGDQQSTAPEAKDSLPADTQQGTEINKEAEGKFDITIANIPPPFLIMDVISGSGMSFNKQLVNSFENSSNYSTARQKALNFGVYNIDLGYVVAYDQKQEVMKYIAVNSKLAEDIGAGPMFNDIASQAAVENSLNNRDSMLALLSQAYEASDKFLRNNERLVAATHVLIGGWVECNHILLQLINGAPRNKKNEVLYDKVWEQRAVINDIMELIALHKNDAEFKNLQDGLAEVQKVFAELKVKEDLTRERVAALQEKIAAVRTMIVK